MRTTGKTYTYLDSFGRMDEILDESDNEYQEQNYLPARSSLTFTNGFYANCVAVFVDIRDSSRLPAKYRRPSLAKLYRTFISEMVAVVDGNVDCDEVNIVGDGVWAVIDTPTKEKVSKVVETIGQLSSAIDVLNKKLLARGYQGLRVGIGVDWGRALVVKAGLPGSGISDIVYMGEVVNAAAKLAAKGEQETWVPRVMAGEGFVSNISNETYKNFFTLNLSHGCYTASIVNTAMNDWMKINT
jgi:class 3 adenylate cyclase